jgi:uncharacterized protein (DUF1330 family)
MERSIQPSARSIEKFMQKVPAQGPLVMLNLLKYREYADYPEAGDTQSVTGREAYERYRRGVVPILQNIGARMLWMGQAHASLIAPESETWDDAFLVHYPSKEAFLRMIASREYKDIVMHRMAALEDSRLIATTPLAQ